MGRVKDIAILNYFSPFRSGATVSSNRTINEKVCKPALKTFTAGSAVDKVERSTKALRVYL